jgi:uncharacterized protein DUF4440
MRLWRTTKHENSQSGRKSFVFNTRSGYFHSRRLEPGVDSTSEELSNKFVNKQQVLGMVESGFLVITSYDRQVEYVRSYGDMVIVAGSETVVWGGKTPNAGKTEHLRFTGIWMKQNGRCQEVARHANIVPQQS